MPRQTGQAQRVMLHRAEARRLLPIPNGLANSG